MKYLLFLFTFFFTTHLFCQVNFEKPFAEFGIQGSITIYDYKTKKWTFSNESDSRIATLPASTFKILNTLIALETGVISDENEIVKWRGTIDSIKYGNRPEIYHDMNMKEAFKLSAGWFYVEMAKKIGEDRYKEFLTRSNYGNEDFSIDDPDFWNFGNFAVTPVNQIEILIGIYDETLPFSARSFKILKEMMGEEQTDKYTLRSKTGWARDGGNDTGWWVGYIERKDNVYFFATRVIKSRGTINPDFARCRKEITRNILKQMHILD